MSGPLLVVAPHATRTGSTRVLLDLLGSSVGELGVPVAVRLLSGGPLEGALRAFGPDLAPGEVPAAALANSCLAAEALAGLPDDVPTAVYAHETGDAIGALSAEALVGLRRAERVLCVSEQSRVDLLAVGVDVSRLELLPPVVRRPEMPGQAAIAEARALAGATPGVPLVLGCGEATWRKGTDLFVEVGRAFSAAGSHPGVRFAWVGRRGRTMARWLDHEVAGTGQASGMGFLGEVPDPAPLLAAADLVLMPSREDPQPLVPIEAALLGTPTVGFDLGGLRDLAAVGAAATAPYPDAVALAAVVAGVLDDPGVGEQLVRAAVERARTRQSPEVIVPRFVAAVRALLDGATAR